ncbi:cytochrome c' [Thioploca ingrica]|uniref:Cytochrome c n=1 Tax=Thioploca ingrica TaxID=40754 RepID=A0A090AN01_9GAMM|nr:cytochrome c' [Thioploca ingrica]
MLKHPIIKVVLSCLLVATLSIVWAETPTNDTIKNREKFMKDMGKHMKAIKKILDGKVDAAEMSTHVNGMETLTKRLSNDLKNLFPVGSDMGETDAKPVIWKKWDEFAKIAQSASDKGAVLAKVNAAGGKATIETAYKDLGDVCKTCHKDYRTEK